MCVNQKFRKSRVYMMYVNRPGLERGNKELQ